MRKSAAFLLLSCMACDGPPTSAERWHSVRIAFSGAATAERGSAVQGPFVSVVDSVALVVTPSGENPIPLGRRVTRRETSVEFSVDVPEGSTTFVASVLSTNRSLLFAGTTTVNVNRDDQPVEVILQPRAPVLLVTRDSVLATFPLRAVVTDTAVYVHNRGSGTLGFGIVDRTQGGGGQCAPNRCFFLPAAGGTVAGGDSLRVLIDSIRRFSTAIPLTFTSPQGDVAVILRTVP